MNPIEHISFSFNLPSHYRETGFVWHLAKKKKRAMAKMCKMFLFLRVQFPL